MALDFEGLGKSIFMRDEKKTDDARTNLGGMYTESGIGLYADANEVMVDGWSRAD